MSSDVVDRDLERHFRQQVLALAERHTDLANGVASNTGLIMSLANAGMDLICSAAATAAANSKSGHDESMIDIVIAHVSARLAGERQVILQKARSAAGGGVR
jgi:hypothetical protein